jgi:hypothetical protein
MLQTRTVLAAVACLSIFCGHLVTEAKAQRLRGEGPRAALPSSCDTLATPPPPDSNFPSGFDYPQNVNIWVQNGDGHRIRFHAWCLFIGLNQPSKPQTNAPFIWQTWKTSTQAFPYQYNPWKTRVGEALPNRPTTLNSRNFANAKVGGANPINNPPPVYPIKDEVAKKYPTCTEAIQMPMPIPPGRPKWYQLKDGVHLQSNGDIMVAGVIYNDAAINNILGKTSTGLVTPPLYNADVLNGLLPKDKNDPAKAIPEFPTSSIVLKPMFWPVKKGGFTALPVWDWDANPPGSAADGQYAGYEMQKFWTRAVAITDMANATPPPKITYLHGVYDSTATKLIGPITYDNTTQISPPAFQVVSVNDFYHRQLNQAELNGLSTCDRALLDASAYWAYDRPFQPGDYVVLIAMHIMTKEQQDWAFQSLWYHPDADKNDTCRYCKARPTKVDDKTFRHYLLTTTYGQTQQAGPPPNTHYYAPSNTLPGATLWPVAYNPYIELAASHPITTNCMNCHHRAAWPPLASQHKPDEGRTSAYLQDNPPNPNVLETYQTYPPTAPIFNGLVTLDAMWAVSDRAGYPPGSKKR